MKIRTRTSSAAWPTVQARRSFRENYKELEIQYQKRFSSYHVDNEKVMPLRLSVFEWGACNIVSAQCAGRKRHMTVKGGHSKLALLCNSQSVIPCCFTHTLTSDL